ncbi:phospholipase D-like domain-containing protein [Brevundimonas basaltis]|uniref:Phospholipase D n=1 Tax=Brevundimonas basaltis TaxID=472166 RepID=A0A7W8MH63_9CAUL|nr:phospholipase D-like domain-containing protein [Brevundimonas basaltis]MBB5292948.1 phosphatidylserine/phosphatidylglycerophosphate/cardiolipin synthase-like enzyme [Brevundimonas basaltis]
MLLKEGATCWQVGTAPRAAFLLDMADYFLAAREAMSKAKRSVHLLNWAFDPDTLFDPQPGCTGPDGDRFGAFLKALACDRPELDVRVLCWKSALPIAATQNFFPLKARQCFAGTPVEFVLDGALPIGASHHQKVLIIDDAVAFCGGGDIGPDRWDTSDHLDDNPRREKTPRDHTCFDSRHEVMTLVDGEPARTLGRLFRERWLRATGETLPEPGAVAAPSAWPARVKPDFRRVPVGLSRSVAAWRDVAQVRESEALYLASFAAAKRCIYLENQYFTSPLMAEALARRLGEARGPEVVLISTQHSPSYFDQMTMDRTRSMFLKRLKDADKHGRFHAYSPVTPLGRTIIVHAKMAIIDDVLLRVGSSNLNNRSFGFDTECDLSIEARRGAAGAATRSRITDLRTGILAHWFGCDAAVVQTALESHASLGKAIEALRQAGYCRLRPLEPEELGPMATFIATFHLGDPITAGDAWRPWTRRKRLKAALDSAARKVARAGLPTPPRHLSKKSV